MGFIRRQIENSPPGKVIRKTSRAATGGAALFIAFLAIMVFRHGLGIGTGTGSGTGTSANPPGSRPASEPLASTMPPTAAGTVLHPEVASGGLTSDEKKALTGNVLTLLIDGHDYLMQIPGGSEPMYRPVLLDRAVELAGMAQGDANGIRVHIRRRENARASAEEKLKLELGHGHITASSIHMAEDFVP